MTEHFSETDRKDITIYIFKVGIKVPGCEALKGVVLLLGIFFLVT